MNQQPTKNAKGKRTPKSRKASDDKAPRGKAAGGKVKEETHAFQAEVSKLLHLMVHSVYSNQDIFLRELISNAADACERLRYRALSEPGLLGDDANFRVTLSANTTAQILQITDNGCGMSRDELAENLGTIARSGTRAFLDNLGDNGEGSALIGQFGVGFYSAFMVADEVTVVSRAAGSKEVWRWRSDGKGAFTINPLEASDPLAPARGTIVTLHLSKDRETYAEASTVERIVREYSAHVPVPIFLLGEQTTAEEGGASEKQLADGSALWRKSRSEISSEEYKEFYSHVSGQFDQPAQTIHYRAEGRQEYSVLAFIPAIKPFDLFDPSRKGRVRLYVRRVFIADDVELLPAWLRFVRGVVDSEDLPLNLSREMLQDNPVLEAIRSGFTNRMVSELKKSADNDRQAYENFWDNFGAVLKEGLYEDMERRDKLLELALFQTTGEAGKDSSWRQLSEYVADMKANQTQIFYATGASKEAILASPHLEGYRKRGIEVLMLFDPVDAFWVQMMPNFDGKPFQSITQGNAALDRVDDDQDDKTDDDNNKDEDKSAAPLEKLIERAKEQLADKVSDVRSTGRLAQSPVCLVAADHGPDRQLEKLLSRQQGGGPAAAPILEINPEHGLIRKIAAELDKDKDAACGDILLMLYDQARILDGEAPVDPADFSKRLNRMMESTLK